MGAVTYLAQQGQFSDRQLNIIKHTTAADTNPDEFDLFCEVARRGKFDPFKRQISAIVFNKDDPQKRKMSIIVNIDGLRAVAFRSGRYRPDDEAPATPTTKALKDPNTNPLGIEKAEVRVYIRDEQGETWRPVAGVAYWDEFAPIREEGAEGFTWVETDEVWPAGTPRAGQKKRRKQQNGEIVRKLDTSGQWGRMGRVMLAKCAEAQALRKAFPEDLSGLYEASELDQARASELTASERIEAFSVESRLEKAGIINTIMMSWSPASGIEATPIGQIADRAMEVLRTCDLRWLDWFVSTNKAPLNEFWGRAKSDCLAVKRRIEERRAELVKLAQETGGGANDDALDAEVEEINSEDQA